MKPYGDTDKRVDERSRQTERALDKWRAGEKPASGAPVYVEPRAAKPRKPSSEPRQPDTPDEEQYAARSRREQSAQPTASAQPSATERANAHPGAGAGQGPAKRSARQERTVTIELPPFIRIALLVVLGLCVCGVVVVGVRELLPRAGIELWPAATEDAAATPRVTMDPLATIDPNATATPAPTPTVDPNQTPDPNATLDPNATEAPVDPNAPILETDQAKVYVCEVEGSQMHLVRFEVDDGNIFIDALNESFPVVNGCADVYIDDSEWFDSEPANDATASVTLNPVLTKLSGEVTVLDTIEYEVEVPASPLELIQPASGYEEVLISLYTLQMRVQPGSRVTVNGNDMSDFIDKRGYLSVNQTVEPIGDNVINVSVLTPSHKETRAQITLYRPVFDIPLELDINTIDSTSTSNVTISGTFEPGATVTVSPAAVSSEVDSVNGTFRFEMNLTRIGDNTITITASEPGKEDSVITHNVYYLPTEAEYSAKAWKMDYSALLNYYEVWVGRIFLCQGEVVELLPEPTPDPNATEAPASADTTISNQLLLLNVGEDKEQLVYIENYSNVVVEAGKSYKMFADVVGLKSGYPYLIARYVYEIE
ncbi:MAG TPA: hypothetical protein IAC59_00050 [Candidatus Fimadaptatus faecigallinarum]|uniref:Uncharacterized protein n=1 Tax=Candidatus Fimadaptatus faecigallinarum TaxID=2840814 RepID=A0A9D1LPK5_9FIRM|nr:hypothetical protein [Candidatus Fimadaptatus faecigallinarum]